MNLHPMQLEVRRIAHPQHVLMNLRPLLDRHLNILIAIDRHEIILGVHVSQSSGAFRDRGRGHLLHLGVDPVDQRAVLDGAVDDDGNVARGGVEEDFDFELGGAGDFVVLESQGLKIGWRAAWGEVGGWEGCGVPVRTRIGAREWLLGSFVAVLGRILVWGWA